MLGVPKVIFSLHASGNGADALSPTARSIDGAFSLPAKSTSGVLRAKNIALIPFSKVDEVELYPYYLGEVAFHFLTYREDPLDFSS